MSTEAELRSVPIVESRAPQAGLPPADQRAVALPADRRSPIAARTAAL